MYLAMSNSTVTVDIFSDVVCPWCVIGGVRLAKAMQLRPELTFERYWHPFMLDPDAVPGQPWQATMTAKFGSEAKVTQMFEYVTNVATQEGLRFDFDAIPCTTNTHDAHRLILLASTYQLTWPLTDALYSAYFSEGADINDHAVLSDIAVRVGLPADKVAELLTTDAFAEIVTRSQQTAAQLGISGVPFFIFNRRLAVSGAQSVEYMLQAIDEACATS